MARIYDPFAAHYESPELTAPETSQGGSGQRGAKVYDPFTPDYESPEQGVVLPSIKRAGGQIVESLGTTIEDITGPNAVTKGLQDFGGGVVRNNPSQINSLGDILDNPWTTVKEAVAEQVPQLGAAYAGAAGGAALGSLLGPAGAAVGGVVGGLAPIAVQEYGEIRGKQKESGEENVPLALASAAGATALERFGLEKFATKAGAKGVAEALGAVPQGAGRLAHAGKEALKTAVIEGPGTEIPQTAIERFAGGQDVTSPDAFEEYGMAGVKGAVGGGAIGGGLGLVAPRENTLPAPATGSGVVPSATPGASPTPQPSPSRGEGEEGAAPEVGLADLDPEQSRHMEAIGGQGPLTAAAAAGGLPSSTPASVTAVSDTAAPTPLPSRRSRGRLSPLGAQQAERARADIAAEQVRTAELAARGPLGRAVARGAESGSLPGAVSFAAPPSMGTSTATAPATPTATAAVAQDLGAKPPAVGAGVSDDASRRSSRNDDATVASQASETPHGLNAPRTEASAQKFVSNLGARFPNERFEVVPHPKAPQRFAIRHVPAAVGSVTPTSTEGTPNETLSPPAQEERQTEGRRRDGALQDVAGPGQGPDGRAQGQGEGEAQAGEPLELAKPLDQAAHQAATSPHNDLPQPSEPQKQAGNYHKGHIRYGGLDISVENPKGSKRSGIDPKGKPWEVEMSAHYGYVRRSEGADGEQVDVYIASDREDTPVFVVDQVDPKTGRFDEHKIVMGAASREEAERVYDSGFSDGSGPSRRKAITELPIEGFKAWLREGGDTKKPIATQKPSLLQERREPSSEASDDGAVAGTRSATPGAKTDTPTETPAPAGVSVSGERKAPQPQPPVTFQYQGRTITVTPPKRLGYNKLVLVDAAKFDAAWARDKTFYVGPGGTGAAIEGRYQEFEKFIATHDSIKASWVDVDAQGRVSFGDGRHRLAVLRDAGLTALPVGMNKASIRNAEKAGMLVLYLPKAGLLPARLAGEAPSAAQADSPTAHETPAPAATPGDSMDAAVDHALSAATASGWTLPRTQGTPTLLNKLGMLAYLDTDLLDALATRRDIPHNEYFRMLQNAWSDYERNDREEPGSKYPAEDLQRQLEALERKLAALLPGLEKANAVTAEFYRTQVPALIAAARKTAGIGADHLAGVGKMLAGPVTAEPTAEAQATAAPTASSPAITLAHALRDRILEKPLERITAMQLFAMATKAYGGTAAQGKYVSKDAYDALELALNLATLKGNPRVEGETAEIARAIIDRAEESQNLLPTPSKRSGEQMDLQQFSTPHTHAHVMAWVAHLGPGDIVLEPSAGTGNIVTQALLYGPKSVHANEISPRRAELVSELGVPVSRENAAHIDALLPGFTPTVVLMNPPFSANMLMKGKKATETGAAHVAAALKKLAPGGRLVALLGRGMGFTETGQPLPRFREWWGEVQKVYNVRAVYGISGREYRKFGTEFDTALVVIDKTGPTAGPIAHGSVEKVSDLPALLEGIRNDRREATAEAGLGPRDAGEQAAAEPGGQEGARGAGDRETGARDAVRLPVDRVVPAGEEAAGAERRGGHAGRRGAGESSLEAGDGNGVPRTEREQPRREAPAERRGDVRDGADGARNDPNLRAPGQDVGDRAGLSDKGLRRDAISRKVEDHSRSAQALDPAAVFEKYRPRIAIKGAKPHPAILAESAAMASVKAPESTYLPNLPKRIIEEGRLSDAQLVNVIQAGQSHGELLPNGERRGYFIGDGTGVGKGAQIAGIILDNWNQGRKRAVWVSENGKLFNDAGRDIEWVGMDKGALQLHNKFKSEIPLQEGVLFTTYDTLKGEIGGEKDANPHPLKRLDQIVKWLGEDFDGVIAFDEAHNLGNSLDEKGDRGVKKAAGKALAGVELQKRLPKARIVYVSATGATSVENLAYTDRLGLWGEGTAFASKRDFIDKIKAGGVATMEVVAKDMKAMGLYEARNLAFAGVVQRELLHSLTPDQTGTYNEIARAWQLVLDNVNAALKITGAEKSSRAKSNALSQFWGSQQRFFNQVLTSLSVPTLIRDAETQLKAGRSVVMQLVNTNEAVQERRLAQAAEQDIDIGDIDINPRDVLMQYVGNAFPTQLYEKQLDDNGNEISVSVKDSAGNPVEDPEAVRRRDALLEKLASLAVPEGVLEQVINHFGTKEVAEITGRSRRVLRLKDGTTEIESLSPAKSNKDADAFMQGGKRILIFSDAGGTGRSYHADLKAKNQQKRIHYLVQPGWRADKAVQGLGRTHRTNQKHPPEYVLVTTNLKAQRRFMSSIARRLDQLGALTKGQRDTASQGLFSAEMNLENQYGQWALRSLMVDMLAGRVPGITKQTLEKEMGLYLTDPKTGAVQENKMPSVPRFLNRMLALESETMDRVFDAFYERLEAGIDYARQQGTLDVGMETITAQSVEKLSDQVIAGGQGKAETRYVKLALTDPVRFVQFDQLPWTYKPDIARNRKSGKLYAFVEAPTLTDPKTGELVQRLRRLGVRDQKYLPKRELEGDAYEMLADLPRKELRAAWDAEIAKSPQTRTTEMHLVTGALLPIWDRLPTDTPKVLRTETDEGERLLGREIPPSDLSATLKALGAQGERPDLSPVQMARSIMEDGATLGLANGWRIGTHVVSGEERIEVMGPTGGDISILKDQGAFTEIISFRNRVFIPTGNAAGIIDRITTSKPVVEVLYPKGATADSGVRYSRSAGAEAIEVSARDDDVTVALKLLAENDELFQLPRSDFKSLSRIAKDVTEQLKAMARDILPDMEVEDLGSRYLSPEDEWAGWWQIRMPDGNTADVYQSKDGYVHINASDLKSGQSRGSALYHLVANFAFNNGLVFRGDPLGINRNARLRRTENMLSSALKFGTTRHLEPHPDQGVAWRKGDDGANIASLARKSVANIKEVFPQIDDISYNFETRTYEAQHTDLDTGRRARDVFDRAAFDVAAYSARGARSARAGGATFARAALINTLLRRSGQNGWDGVLAQITGERGPRGLSEALRRIFYSKAGPPTGPAVEGRPRGPQSTDRNQKPGPAGLSASGLRETLAGRFGGGVGRLIDAGTLRIVQHDSELPRHLNDGKGGIRGVYDSRSDTTWMVADNLTAADAPSVFLHELGVHYGLERMVGREKYEDIIRQMKGMEALGNEAALAARAAIPNGTPKAAVDDELVAYLVEKHPELPIVKRIIAAIRAFLFRHGLIKNIKPADVVALAKAAARHAARGVVMNRAGPAADLTPEPLFARRQGPAPQKALSSRATRVLDALRQAQDQHGYATFRRARGMIPDMSKADFDAGALEMRERFGLYNSEREAIFSEKDSPLRSHRAEDAEHLVEDPKNKNASYGFQAVYSGMFLRALPKEFQGEGAGPRYSRGEPPPNVPDKMVGAPAFSRAAQTDTPEFRAWFGRSKVVGKNRKPMVVYHGTRADIHEFRLGRDGGIYFSDSADDASGFGERYTVSGANGASRVMPVFLSLQNPLIRDVNGELYEPDIAAHAIAEAQSKGRDGVILKNIVNFEGGPSSTTYIAFNSEQVKSSIGNVGTFDPANPDIRYSRGEPGVQGRTASGEVQDEPPPDLPRSEQGRGTDPNTPEGAAEHLGRIGEAMRTTRHGWEAIKSKMLEDWRPAWLGLFTRRQIVDIGQGMVPQLANYDRAVQAMDADRNQFDDEAHEVAEVAAAFVRKDRKEADQLFDLMHSATLAGADPAERFRPSINRNEAYQEMSSLRRRMRGRSGEADVLQAQIDQIQIRLDNEKVRKLAHPGLARRYFGLSQEAKVVYATMRDLYQKRFDQREEALIQRIRDAEADERWKARLIADIKHRFETARLSAPYFPLTRFGDYWVAAVNPDGEKEYHLRESTHQQKALIQELTTAGYHEIAHGFKMDSLFEQQGASAGFVSQVIKLLDKGMRDSPGASDIKDSIYQMYLQSLPELSARKHWIHRQKTPGFSKDALRGFAKQMFHGNRQLAKLRHQTAMEKALAAARKGVRDADDPNRAAQLVNEMQKRDEWIKNPTTSTWANVAGSIGFLWYLTAPASAIVNVTQTPLVAYPLLAARHGWGKSAQALSRATSDFFRGRFSVEGAIQGEDLAAYQRFLADGVIDKTQSHDLAGMSETPSAIYSGRAAKLMRASSFLFHRAERMNREVTALAAFRLGRAQGLGVEEAYQQAKQFTWESHFDYSNSNKARFIQHDAMRVLLMFKQFSQHMTYLLARSAQQSIKGLTPALRREARLRLTGMLGMHALFAGALGMPLMGTLSMVMNALFDDDEDEPWDFEVAFRNFLAEAFGPDVGQAIARGPVESLTRLGISSRVGLSDLWVREPDKTLEGRGLVEYWTEQFLGPLGGIALKAGTAYDMFQDGHTMRALESMQPTAISSGLRMLRYAGEGVQNLRGDPVMEDVSAWNLVGQAAGFSPAELGQKYDANRALKDLEQRIETRSQRLINRWWLARRTGDLEGVREAMAEIGRFNGSTIIRQNPRARITPATLLASMQQRRNYSRRAEGGIIVDRRLSRLGERVSFGG
jgi:predicted RNA methylase